MQRELDGRRVLVVGGSKGIGRALAVHLAAQGAAVVVSGRDRAALEATVDAADGSARAVVADLAEPAGCEQLVSEAADHLGGIDALVYCPGTTTFGRAVDATRDDWLTVFGTNVFAAAGCTRAALPHLAAAHGHAVYFSSNAAEAVPPWEGIGLYVASKLALESAIRSWQTEVPEVAFTSLRIGPTVSEFRASHPEGAEYGARWLELGQISPNRLDPSVHARAVEAILREDAVLRSATTTPRPTPRPTPVPTPTEVQP